MKWKLKLDYTQAGARNAVLAVEIQPSSFLSSKTIAPTLGNFTNEQN